MLKLPYKKSIACSKMNIAGYCMTLLLSLPACAREYTAVAGTVIIIESYSAQQITDKDGDQDSITFRNENRVAPFMGGLALPGSSSQYSCLNPSAIREVDGRKGIEISPSGIIGGVTGTITGGIASVMYLQGETIEDALITTFRGGISFDARGYSSPIGDTSEEAANNLCAGASMPYEINSFTYPNTKTVDGFYIGNTSGIFDGYIWIYVPTSISPGTYNLVDLGIVQGASRLLRWNGYMPITMASDTVTVIPPPCTISTETQIVFDTTSEAGKTVSAPITFQCGDISSGSLMKAHIIAQAVGVNQNAAELSLTYSDNSSHGGKVRGYIGQNTTTSGCVDTNESLFFDGRFGANLGDVINGNTTISPLVWQLCTSGNETPGVATGSVIIDIGYK